MEIKFEFKINGMPWEKGQPTAYIVWPEKDSESQAFASQKYDSEPLKKWHNAILNAAKKAMFREPRLFGGSLGMQIVYFLPRPLAHYKSDGSIKKAYSEVLPVQARTGVNRLNRAIIEGIEGVVIHDRNHIVIQNSMKMYRATGSVVVKIWNVTARDIDPEVMAIPQQLDFEGLLGDNGSYSRIDE